MAASSLRGQLMRWLMVPLLLLWCADFAFTYADSVDEVNVGFDRTLAGSALMMAERVAVDEGRITVDIPIAAIQMLENAFRDRVYYGVVDLSDGSLVTGYGDLPRPRKLPEPDAPLFYEGRYKGAPVRFVAFVRPVFDPVAKGPVLVQVGESTGARQAQARRILVETTVKELASIALIGALLWWGVARGLRPLERLRERVLAQSRQGSGELAPIPPDAVPAEVAPLIDAINAHTARQHAMNEAQRQFIADASHQLKTPLTVLKTQAELALRQGDVAAMRAVVERMLASTDATSRMVQQLLALARSEAGGALPAERLDLARLARATTLELAQRAIAQGVDLGYEGADALFVDGNAVLLRELLLNLLDNALRYIGGPGHVTVRVRAGEDAAPTLEVDDDGPGIAPQDRAQLTQRFFRGAGGKGDGAGLGMAIVAGIAARHGAALSFDGGSSGRGLCVRLRFPAAAPAAPAVPA